MFRFALIALVVATPLAAQAPNRRGLDQAAATITEADVARRVGIIADDSMMGRDTPSRGLDLTAQYVADQFKSFGLKPGGENGTWFQRYYISRTRLDPGTSHVGFMIGGNHLHVELSSMARFLYGGIPEREVGGPAMLIAGKLDSATVKPEDVKEKVVLLVLDRSGALPRPATIFIRGLVQAGPRGILLISNRDSATFAAEVGRPSLVRQAIEGMATAAVPVIEVHERALPQVLSAAGINPAELRSAPGFVSRAVPGLTVMIDLKQTVLERDSAPNTIGILEGSDPTLKNEYIVYSAHMDHIGITSGRPDSINNGADDDGSGTVGVVELAEAFSKAPPRRSVIFITVSGEEKGLWGSQYFADHPTVPVNQIVADFNIDMIGRNWKDTIVAIGKEHSDLGATLNRVNQEHPELGMTAIDDRWPNENFYFRSDHYNFARKGIPILFFFSGVHADYHKPSDSPDKIDAEKESRILKLLFYLGQEVGSTTVRPRWNPESYEQIVKGGGR